LHVTAKANLVSKGIHKRSESTDFPIARYAKRIIRVVREACYSNLHSWSQLAIGEAISEAS